MKRDRDALQQAKVVSKNLSQEEWFSTQSTAFALMAMGRLAENYPVHWISHGAGTTSNNPP